MSQYTVGMVDEYEEARDRKMTVQSFLQNTAKYSFHLIIIKITPMRMTTCMKLSVPMILPMWWNWYAQSFPFLVCVVIFLRVVTGI